MKLLIPIIIAVIIVILTILIIIFLNHHDSKSKNNTNTVPNSTISAMHDTFNNTTTDLNNIGGFLANNFGIEWFNSMLQHGDVSLQDTAVCAHVNRHTCTAYSYIRRDMIPMLFMYPGQASNVPCGILLDTKKVWPLITLMATVDADTNHRNCCTNESGVDYLTRNPFKNNRSDYCIFNTLVAKYGREQAQKYSNYAVYIPNTNKGAKVPTSCNGDQTCMYNNSGGSLSQWVMNGGMLTPDSTTKACSAGNYKDCFNFKEVPYEEVPNAIKYSFKDKKQQPSGWLEQSISDNCPTCTKPYLCVFDNSTGKQPYEIKEEKDRFGVYIGKKGEGYVDLFSNGITNGLGGMAVLQCRFEKKDWNLWMDVVKEWYKTLLSFMTPDNKMSREYDNLLGNPYTYNYFENEVNLYIDPDINSEEYKKQNKIWQDSIVAFYYTATKCEDQFKPLIGVETHSNVKNPITGKQEIKIWNNNIDRCDDYYFMQTDQRRAWESIHIEEQRELVYKVADMFNKKYNKNVPVFACVADSNAFPNYKSLNKALNGTVTFDDIFREDTGFNTEK